MSRNLLLPGRGTMLKTCFFFFFAIRSLLIAKKTDRVRFFRTHVEYGFLTTTFFCSKNYFYVSENPLNDACNRYRAESKSFDRITTSSRIADGFIAIFKRLGERFKSNS